MLEPSSDTENFMGLDGKALPHIFTNAYNQATFLTQPESGILTVTSQPLPVDLDQQWQLYIPSRLEVTKYAIQRLQAEYQYFQKREQAANKRRKTSFLSLISYNEETPKKQIRDRQNTSLSQAFKSLWRSKNSQAVQAPPMVGVFDPLPDTTNLVSRAKVSKLLGIPELQEDMHFPVEKKSYTVGHRRHQSFNELGAQMKQPNVKRHQRRQSTLELPQEITQQRARSISFDQKLQVSPPLSPTQATIQISTESVSGLIGGSVSAKADLPSPIASLSRVDKVSVARSLTLKAILMLEYDLASVQSVLGDPQKLYFPILNISLLGEDISELLLKFCNHRKADSLFIQHYLESKVRSQQFETSLNKLVKDQRTILLELAVQTDSNYHLAQYLEVMLTAQNSSWQVWCRETENMSADGNVLAMQALIHFQQQVLQLDRKGKLRTAFVVQTLANDFSDDGYLESLKTKLYSLLDCAAHDVNFPSKECMYDLGRVHLHEKSVLAFVPQQVERSKKIAAEYFRKAFQLGYDVPDVYMRWIWKKKYQKL